MTKKQKQVSHLLDQLEQEYPNADTRLHFADRFQLLVAVILSAQSTDDQVNKITPLLFELYPEPAAMAAADLPELEQAIKGVGLYKNKARNIKNMARVLLDKYDGEIPGVYEQLLELPGVGTKSANVMLAVGFDLPGLGVDTHVHRVSNRLGLTATKQPQQTEKILKELIPPIRWGESPSSFDKSWALSL